MNCEKIKEIQVSLSQQYGSNLLMILNGQCLNQMFNEYHLKMYGTYIAFNEAMCMGDVDAIIFSNEFIKKRCEIHQVTREMYEEITLKPIQLISSNTYDTIVLWFDDDMFCQINLLTILAYLEQLEVKQPIKVVLFNQGVTTFHMMDVPLGQYNLVYQSVLTRKENVQCLDFKLLNEAIKRYLSLQTDHNEIIEYIKNHLHLEEDELISKLLVEFSCYGLGDSQYISLIKRVREQ